ncbi:uroporphyrinogen-III synthase [Salipaludibacillus agaradhaerens]|uniref:uroporphyrinogen-III synthase n=1 Tax=Salipaludibacillus agaradhaerens TaxID=76935 RepID=UPI0021508C3F|nr:uroporphyrinogen-III synthase [Salipaludibacillus agaradhaerens]MCR6107469.1 uroporphyrinogen-III synthase [Salipaludibacillus agaradhaerens]MCR6119498.1 uroporphyrinogen-III synthase [Salipaludibacillus agaradhaerens]
MQSLEGITVLNTRPPHQAHDLSKAIEQEGGRVYELPLILLEPPEDKLRLQKELEYIHTCNWIIFTSVNSFTFFLHAVQEAGYSPESIMLNKKVAVVGKKTAKCVQEAGYGVDLIPSVFNAEYLRDALIAKTDETASFFYPRSQQARPVLSSGLQLAGRRVFEMIVYRTMSNKAHIEQLHHLLKYRQIDVIILTSPSAVKALFDQVSCDLHKLLKESLMFAVIGNVTKKALQRYGVKKIMMPETFTSEGLVATIKKNSKQF